MFDWQEYLKLATTLAQNTGHEASLRSAISRAYYAVFCNATNQLRNEGATARFTHKFVWDTYKSHTNSQRRKIGVTGDRLRRSRNLADYDDRVSGLQSLVTTSLQRATSLLQSLQRLP